MEHPSLKKQVREIAKQLHASDVQENVEKLSEYGPDARLAMLAKIEALEPGFVQTMAMIGFQTIIVAMIDKKEKAQSNEL